MESDSAPDTSEPDEARNLKRIPKVIFEEGRAPRYGSANPEKMEVPFWKLALRFYIDPWHCRDYFLGGNDPEDRVRRSEEILRQLLTENEEKSKPERITDDVADPANECKESTGKVDTPTEESEEARSEATTGLCDGGPIWCSLRFGQTTTELPDGSIVKIAGEHEDFYDPDFCIYNDVMVYPPRASQAVEHSDFAIYGYPEDVFPPTDFHTATFIPQLHKILVLGNMSSQRCEADEALAMRGITPVYLLDVGTWKFEKKETNGDGPGIIWHHEAELIDGVLRVSTRVPGDDSELLSKTTHKLFEDGKGEWVEVEPGTVWELSLDEWTWKLKATLTGT